MKSVKFIFAVKIHDILGREVETFLNKVMEPGKYNAIWDAAGYSSGVYFYRLQSGTFIDVKKMVLLQ